MKLCALRKRSLRLHCLLLSFTDGPPKREGTNLLRVAVGKRGGAEVVNGLLVFFNSFCFFLGGVFLLLCVFSFGGGQD